SNAVAFWLGNPVLNPAVIAFLALVAPWSWVATRVAVGLLVVLAVPALVARFAPAPAGEAVALEDDAGVEPAPSLARYLRALARLAVVLIPEYLVVVLLVGGLRGWLLPIGDASVELPVLITLAAAVLGALVVIPTGGEIPLLAGLAAAGVGRGPIGALLIALPAISLPSMAMTGRALGVRATLTTAGGVIACAVVAGGLLWALGP
ncbi:MAG: permease, partial [Conexibacter sp.]|nr:permease [Conexibacter sp.]